MQIQKNGPIQHQQLALNVQKKTLKNLNYQLAHSLDDVFGIHENLDNTINIMDKIVAIVESSLENNSKLNSQGLCSIENSIEETGLKLMRIIEVSRNEKEKELGDELFQLLHSASQKIRNYIETSKSEEPIAKCSEMDTYIPAPKRKMEFCLGSKKIKIRRISEIETITSKIKESCEHIHFESPANIESEIVKFNEICSEYFKRGDNSFLKKELESLQKEIIAQCTTVGNRGSVGQVEEELFGNVISQLFVGLEKVNARLEALKIIDLDVSMTAS